MGLLLLQGNTGPTFTSGLLDSFGSAAGAYSIRRLRLGHTGPCMRVRRSSDSTEQDIGFRANGDVDTAGLLLFCGAGNGFVTKWYDQSGNSKDAAQATTTAQPQVVSSGSLITEGGKLALQYDGTNDGMTTGISALTLGTSVSVFDVKKTSDTDGIVYWGNNNLRWFYYVQSGSVSTTIGDRFSFTNGYRNDTLQTLTTRGNWFTVYANGTRHVSSVFGAISLNDWTDFGWCNYTGFETSATMQEIIVYATDRSANRAAINSNINTYFGVY